MAQQAQGTKGNPASKRMGNVKLKERRNRSWKRGQDKKAEHRTANEIRFNKNEARRAMGEPTPWQHAKNKRWVARHPE